MPCHSQCFVRQCKLHRATSRSSSSDQQGPHIFLPTTQDLAHVFGRTYLDFEYIHVCCFSDFCSSYPDSEFTSLRIDLPLLICLPLLVSASSCIALGAYSPWNCNIRWHTKQLSRKIIDIEIDPCGSILVHIKTRQGHKPQEHSETSFCPRGPNPKSKTSKSSTHYFHAIHLVGSHGGGVGFRLLHNPAWRSLSTESRTKAQPCSSTVYYNKHLLIQASSLR